MRMTERERLKEQHEQKKQRYYAYSQEKMEKASAHKEELVNCLTQELMTALHKSCMLTPRSKIVRETLMGRLQ